MSRLVAFAAIQGGYNIVSKVEGKLERALQTFNADTKVGFPNTAYFLPVIYSLTGIKIETLEDMKKPLQFARKLLPPHVKGSNHLPYLGPLLDAGMAALFAFEIEEALRYLNDPDFYLPTEEVDLEAGKIWLGAADDTVMRKRGVEFVDGSAPGFAAIVGSAPTPEIAKDIVEEYQRRSLYIFCAANQNGTTVIEQLIEADVQVGWNTRIVPFGPDISSAIFALGFANRAAMAFGGVQPGDHNKILMYNKERIFAFVNALGDVNAEWAAAAAGCVNWGFPTIADTDIPEILPTGICTYEHVVANVPHDEMVQKSVEVRGLKTTVSTIEIPCAFGPAFEGERVRGADLYTQSGGGKTQCTEYLKMAEMNEIEDGKVTVIGPDIPDMKEGDTFPMAIYMRVAGREFQEDFEPILERQTHHLINYIQGVMHMGQRDIAWVRVSKAAVDKGFTLKDIGVVLHAKFHQDFGKILDKVEVTIYTKKEEVDKITAEAKSAYTHRDERVETMADEDVEIFYSCTLCQSFAPTHVCTVSPERTGLCGAYNWMDCKASYEINPTGPNQPIEKGEVLDPVMGTFAGVNEFIKKASRGAIESYNFYSMVNDP
jgi:acetyl-CoA synthase